MTPAFFTRIFGRIGFGLLLSSLVTASSIKVSAAIVANEDFNYASGSSVVGQTGGTGFANAWQLNSSGSGSIYTNVPNSLNYTDAVGNILIVSGNSAYFAGSFTGTGTAQPNRDLATVRTNGTSWISFVGVRIGTTTNTLPNNPYPRGANIGIYSNTSQRVAIGNASGAPLNNWSILPLGSTASVQQSTNSFSQVSFVAVRIDHIGSPSTPDNLYMFVNPRLDVEPNTSDAAVSSVGVNDYSFNRILAFAGGYDAANGRPNAEFRVDEIRIGDTYADVTPFTASTNIPSPPAIVASNQSVALLFNTSANLALAASNTNNTALTFYIASNPANGAIGTLSSNLVTYTPNSNYVGLDSFTFYASDGTYTSATATVSLSITNTEILYPSSPQITKDGTAILITDYVHAPISSRTSGVYGELTNNFGDQLGRLNFIRSEPTNAPFSTARFFVADNNRNLYILDRTNTPLGTNSFTSYINFEHVFPKFDNDPGYAGGLVTFQFDPEYASNGVFFTVHTEDPAKSGSAVPTNGYLTGLDVTGYATTAAVNPPNGSVLREAVLVEWTDTNVNNETFEGTARELLRVGFNNNIHPMGDLAFNPLAQPGDSDYRNLYVANGDGGSGESPSTRTTPQRLDALQGKILRITPDLNLRPGDELSANGRYRIPTTGPDPNPFISVSLANLKKEIFAFGFRNCHRITWDPISNLILEDDIGLHSWEEVNIIHKGADYGYSEREGTEQLFVGGTNNGKTGSQVGIAFPTTDALTVTGLVSTVTPNYPVAMYSHRDGDAISSGFVYRGKLLPQLYGKYIFGEITTGRIFYCDLADMIANDDGVRTSLATVHELQVVFNGRARRLFDVISDEYKARGGTSGQALPGNANATAGSDIDGVPYNKGRADIRLGMDNDGELYVLSKSDAMIRRITSVLVPPTISSISTSNNLVTLGWPSISNRVYRVQYKGSLSDSNWNDLPDVTATNGISFQTNSFTTTNRFYRLFMP